MRRFPAQLIVLFWGLAGVAALAQQPSADPASPSRGEASQSATQPSTDEQEDMQPPPTPLEEREKEIRKFDPLGKDDDQDAEDKAKQKAKEKKARDEQTRESARTSSPEPPTASDAGDTAASDNLGPQVVGENSPDAQSPEYTGPAVLSHSYSLNSALIPDNFNWTESVSVSGSYDTGLNSAANGSEGAVQTPYNFGLNFAWSISGRHKIHRDSVGVAYRGSRPWYTSGDQFSGMNSSLAFDYTHIVSRRMTVRLSESINIFSQSYALQNPVPGTDTSVADTNVSATPTTQIFDNGSKTFSTGINAAWQQNSRLSFTAGASYFVSMYNSSAFVGVTGKQFQGGLSYRVNSRATTGIFYSYSVYNYPHGEETADSESFGGLYSYAFSPTTRLQVRAGLATSEELGLQAVPLSPFVAALYGLPAEIIEAYTKSLSEDISASVVKGFGRSHHNIALSYSKGISPGNGLYLASVSESISASTMVNLFRHFPISLTAARSTVSSAALTSGSYVTDSLSIGGSQSLSHAASLSFSANYRHFGVGNANVGDEISFSYGFGWNHTEGKLWPLW